VEVDASAVGAAVEASGLDNRGLGQFVGARHAISSRCFTVGLAVAFVELVVLGIGLVDVTADLQVELGLGRRGGGRLGLGVPVLPPLGDDGVGCRLPGLKAARGIANDLEVAGKGRADMGWPLVRIDLQQHVRKRAKRRMGKGTSHRT
jgi:hypothetical protein